MKSQTKVKPPLESREDSYIRKLYRTCGCTVISFSQPRRTKQTPGIPDLLVFEPKSGAWWWHEVKRQTGPRFVRVKSGQSPMQVIFQNLVESFGQTYLIGARDVAEEKLRALNLIV